MFYIYDYMRKQFEEFSGNKLDGRKGTPVDELMVKPTGLVMQEFYDLLVKEKKINSPELWQEWTEEEMNYFASKYFIYRVEGSTVSVTVRVYFDAVEQFNIDNSVSFVSDNNLQYLPADNETITTSSYKKSDISGANYYIDFLCVASAPGDQYQIEENKITGVEGASFSWKFVTNPHKSLGGSTHETNDEFYERIKYSLNDGALNSERGIVANLKKYFPSINSLYIAGAGSPYMTRDLVSGVPQTEEEKTSDFKGKFKDSNMIKSIGFKNVFPPEPGSELADTYWGPHSAKSDYSNPLTIDSVVEGAIDTKSSNPRLSDPAYFGFPAEELTDEQYKNMYFNDIVNKCSFSSKVLFDLKELDLPFTFNEDLVSDVSKIVPDETWVYGEEAYKNGVVNGLPEDVGVKDILNFTYNKITLGASGKTIMIGKDVKKFTGVKYSGIVTWATGGSESILNGLNSILQFILGGTNTQTCDSFSGIGFGIKKFDEWDGEDPARPNVSVFFSMDSRYGTSTIYANDTDLNTHVDTATINALKEKTWRLEPGAPYSFEFIINDNLRLTLIIRKEERLSSTYPDENEFKMELPPNVLQMFAYKEGGIFSFQKVAGSTEPRFGSTMKVVLETPETDNDAITPWEIVDLKAFDINPVRAEFLYGLDVENLKPPYKISIAAEATGSSQGYIAFVWDSGKITNASGDDALTSGGWSELRSASNSDGSIESTSGVLSETIYNADRYVTDSRYGKKVFIMLVPSGTSAPAIVFDGDEGSDVVSEIRVDYIKIESSTALQFHSNTKSDIYINTWKSETEIQPITISIEKRVGEEYFELSRESGFIVPIAEYIEVSVTGSFAGRTLGRNEYELQYPTETYRNSGKEITRLYTLDRSVDSITIKYIPYPDVMRMQDVFEDSRLRSAFGNMLSVHKYPVTLNISFLTTSDADLRNMQDLSRKYIDTLVSSFTVSGFRDYFINSGLNVWDINVEYEYTDDGVLISDTIEESYTIRSIDFFKSGAITVNEQ